MVSLMLVYLTINLSILQEKLIKPKRDVYKHITFFARLKSILLMLTKKVNFPNYKLFNDVNEEYSNFFQKIRIVVDNIVPFKNKRIKANTQKWFVGEVLENMYTRDKSRFHIDKELY